MEEKERIIPAVHYKLYLFIWVALALLTGITVYVAGLDLGKFGIIANILIASLKAGLVVYIFMNLKHESGILKLMLLMTVLTLTVIILLTFLDILYR
jgi:cytochrome c oxidase subunit 4